MLLKLSLSGMKNKRKEYIVLFMGLIMSIAIFYMFETIALNKAFLIGNTSLSFMGIVFHAGTFLLAGITIVYILYANAFLLTLRQKEYGMYMMLGAKKNKISQLMFIETVAIACITLVLGISVGIGLAKGVATLLLHKLALPAGGFEAVYPKSLMMTLVFFALLFIIAGAINGLKLTRLSVLQLLNGTESSERVIITRTKVVIEAVIAVLLLGVGYYFMINIRKFQFIGMFGALITISIGTYFFFRVLLPLFIRGLQKTPRFNDHQINRFTLAQLRFRASDLTKVLALVTMLISLAVGSIAVALVFNNNIKETTETFAVYDSVVKNPTAEQTTIINKLASKSKATYRLKEKDKTIYLVAEELQQQMPQYLSYEANDTVEKTPTQALVKNKAIGDVSDMDQWDNALNQLLPQTYDTKKIIVTEADFNKLTLKESTVIATVVTDFDEAKPQLAALDKSETAKNPTVELTSKYSSYQLMSAMFNGIIFMGLFLGFAFLAMMASCLMFKILVGASADIRRYDMLNKIGVKQALLKQSMTKELGTLFVFPALLATVHVLVGMKMFAYFLMVDVYFKIWLPFVIFIAIYGVYFVITTKLYQGVVFKKK
ncbi:ABC transporter permease [Brochothrix campestris]|uniref:ABC transporter permease n=1 Tax=Brochothrix campestris FSL F6-1037 TaxID=1265861 RepID=W7D7R8_9LIST|nr:ABC transporter permease [Brochothrix campestris]EUJ41398.1 ABC transporter permease [Brochothrix campestris FSL F6-1037]